MQRLPPSPVAIVGIGCRMPGAQNPAQYWDLIREGRTAISHLPESRLDRSLYYSPEKGKAGSCYSELSGLVDETPFDARRFPIDAELIATSDSVHLRMLEVCCEALIDAGLNPMSLPRARTGVYIGHSGGSTLAGDIAFGTYASEVAGYLADDKAFSMLPRSQRQAAIEEVVRSIRRQMPTRSTAGGPNLGAHAVSVLVNRALKLDGPACAIDAACASSLIAIAQAVFALQRGHIDLAIAGGCSFSKWAGLVLFSQAQSISGTGTRPFDADADGLISSDGYAALVMKPLTKAIKDADPILGVIRSVCVASDGRGKSLWAPRREGQISAVRRAYSVDVAPSSLQYIECHATSTQVGDATEVSALAEALRGELAPGQKLPIGSVKGNVGHTLECAGVAGVLKTVLALKNGIIPPQPGIKQLNPEIAWHEVPFYVPTRPEAWPTPTRAAVRRAAVNAFGIGGLNSHIVLDDRPESTKTTVAVPAGINSQSAASAKSSSEARAQLATDRVAVIGMGVVVPNARNAVEFWQLLQSGRSALSEVTDDRWNANVYYQPGGGIHHSPTKLGGFINNYEFDWRKYRIPPKQIAAANPLQFMLLDAAAQAFEDAGYHTREFDRKSVSAVVGTVFGGDFSGQMQIGLRLPHFRRELATALKKQGVAPDVIEKTLDEYSEYVLARNPALNDETGSFTSSTLASRLTKHFDLMGGAWAVDCADVSSLAAVQAAADLLLTGQSEMVLCAAGQRSMDITVFEAFGLTGGLAEGQLVPSFGEGQKGSVPGEGVGVLLLKRLSDAQRDGDRVHAVIEGVSISYKSDDEGLEEVVRRNLHRSLPASPELNGHGTPIDAIEVARPCDRAADRAEVAVYQDEVAVENGPVPLGSTASQIGHLMGASGTVSLIKSILEIEHGELVPSAGTTSPDKALANVDRRFTLPKSVQPISAGKDVGRIVVSNLSASGLVGHLVVRGTQERPRTKAPARVDGPVAAKAHDSKSATKWQVFRLGASSWGECQTELSAVGSLDRGLQAKEFPPRKPCRLGIVATDRNDLERKVSVAQGDLTDARRRHVLADNGVFVADVKAAAAPIAVVFSGQGAQYTGMLKDWAELSPTVGQSIQQMNEVLTRLSLPRCEKLLWDEASDLGKDVLNTQLAVLIGDLVAWAVLRESGISPTVVSGHSYGEFPALVAAGAWDFETAVRATLARTDAVEATPITDGAMLSTSAASDLVNSLLQKLQLPCDIACYNAPDQTIIAGRKHDLDQLRSSLREAGFASREIQVPRPYHSRLMANARRQFADSLKKFRFQTPQIPFLTCGSGLQLADPTAVREGLAAQLTEPVRYVTLIEKLIERGVGAIVECGSRQILTRLNRQILGNRPILHMALDARPGHAAEQQLRLRMMLETLGHQAPTSKGMPSAAATGISASGRGQQEPSRTATMTTGAPQSRASEPGQIVFVDATERRRQRMREAAQAKHGASQNAPGKVATTATANGAKRNGADPVPHSPAPTVPVAPSASRTEPATPAARIAPASSASKSAPAPVQTVAPAASGPARAEIEQFALEYVIEQTGYPPELVEMDASLEADLGIDSIRKAQLLGEIAEKFNLKHAALRVANVSLDDLPTLGSIVAFFLEVGGAGGETGGSRVPETVARPAQTSVAANSEIPAQRPMAAAVAVAEAPARSGVDRYVLEAFIRDFVIEETGYPPELVEMDASLEADLGIDSIRKARLLGEVAERFRLTDVALKVSNVSLDDLPTLESIVQFFEGIGGGSSIAPVDEPTSVVAVQPPVAAEPATATESADDDFNDDSMGLSRDRLESWMLDFVVEQTGYPPELVEMDASLEADLGIDSIRKARLLGELAEEFNLKDAALKVSNVSLDDLPTLNAIVEFFLGLTASSDAFDGGSVVAEIPANMSRKSSESTAPEVSEVQPQVASAPVSRTEVATAKSAGLNRDQLSAFMMDFVIEQTGYPPELVEMDGSLEADLGIDSIRKARMLGEVAEHFRLTDAALKVSNVSLDDLPTLSAIVDFFLEVAQPDSSNSAGESSAAPVTAAPQASAAPAKQYEKVPHAERVMRRYTVRSVAAPLTTKSDHPIQLTGTVLLIGDSADRQAMADFLAARGCRVETLHESRDRDRAVAEVEAIAARQPIDHLVLLPSLAAAGEAWDETCERELLLPFFVCQRWMQLRIARGAGSAPAAVIALSRMGGDFGLAGRIGNITGGGTAGLLKALRREYPELYVKQIDAPSDEPTRLILNLLDVELAAADPTIEVGCIRGKRYKLRMISRPAASVPQTSMPAGGAWIVTGGAKGISARIVKALGMSPGVELHLIGRSEAPTGDTPWRGMDEAAFGELKRSVMRQAAADGRRPADAWNEVQRQVDLDASLQELRAAGLKITYHACDVGDRSRLEQTLAAIRRSGTPIRGVIHAAGVELASRFDRKKPNSVLATVASKVFGARWLWDLTQQDPLTHFVVFGSTSGRFGGLGQADYSMASDLVCRMCSQFAAGRPDRRLVGIHWPPWAEVGMAARPESRIALEAAGLSFLPLQEGVSHLLDELLLDCRDTEVAFVDEVWDIDPTEQELDARLVAIATARSEQVRSAPYAEAIVDCSSESVTIEAVFSPDKDAIVRDHQLDGVPLVPGAALLEMCCEAARLLEPQSGAIEVTGFEILNGVRFHAPQPRRLLATARREGAAIRCSVFGELIDQNNRILDPAREFAVAQVRCGQSVSASHALKPETAWQPLDRASDERSFAANSVGTVYHGRSLSCLAAIADESELAAWFRIDLESCSQTCGSLLIDPVPVVDALLQACDVLLHRSSGASQLPTQIGRMMFSAETIPVTGQLFARTELTAKTENETTWTITCVTAAGEVVLQASDVKFSTLRQARVAPRGQASSEKPPRPLLSRARAVNRTADSFEAEIPVNPASDPFLVDHRLRSRPLLPAVVSLELMAEAAEELLQGDECVLRLVDVSINAPVRFMTDEPSHLKVICRREHDRIVAEIKGPNSAATAVTGTVVVGAGPAVIQFTDPGEAGPYSEFLYPEGAPMFHGPAFRVLRRIAAHRLRGTAELKPVELSLVSESDSPNWFFNPALLDGAIFACGVDTWVWCGNVFEIPAGFDEVSWNSSLSSAECVSHFAFKERGADGTKYDLTVCNQTGQPIMQVRGYRSLAVADDTGSSQRDNV